MSGVEKKAEGVKKLVDSVKLWPRSIVHFLEHLTIGKMRGMLLTLSVLPAMMVPGQAAGERLRSELFAEAHPMRVPAPLLGDNLLALEITLGKVDDWEQALPLPPEPGSIQNRWRAAFWMGSDFARAELAIHAQSAERLAECERRLLQWFARVTAGEEPGETLPLLPDPENPPLATLARDGAWAEALQELYVLQNAVLQRQPGIRALLFGGQWLTGMSALSGVAEKSGDAAAVLRLQELQYAEGLLDDLYFFLPETAENQALVKELEDVLGQVVEALTILDEAGPEAFDGAAFHQLIRQPLEDGS